MNTELQKEVANVLRTMADLIDPIPPQPLPTKPEHPNRMNISARLCLENYGSSIRRGRMRACFSTSQAATLLGISSARLSNYEKSRAEPPIKILLQMCEIYGCSLDELLGLYEDSTSPLESTMRIANI